MEINIAQEGNIVVVSLQGRMDAVSAPKLETFVKEQPMSQSFVLNLESLEYVSSAGLRTLLMFGKQVKADSGNLVLCSLNGIVKEVFELSGFQKLFVIKESLEEALKQSSGG